MTVFLIPLNELSHFYRLLSKYFGEAAARLKSCVGFKKLSAVKYSC